MIATYVDADTFTVTGDQTAIFLPGIRVRANCGVNGYKYLTVLNSNAASVTTVNLTADSDDLTSNLTSVDIGVVSPGVTGSLPVHKHTGEGDGGSVVSHVLAWSVISTATVAIASCGYICDTSGAAFILTLPASPVMGDVVGIADGASTFNVNNLTIGRNALKIMGLAEDMVVSTKNVAFQLVYSDVANGWRIA